LGGRQPGLDFAAAGGDGMPLLLPQDRPRREPRPHAASLDELAAHQAMLATIKTPLWLAA
jgi:DNA polymerase-3 subunit epsilon